MTTRMSARKKSLRDGWPVESQVDSKGKRAVNRAEREKRRDEIKARWFKRSALRIAHNRLAPPAEPLSLFELTEMLLQLSAWAPFGELLDAAECSQEKARMLTIFLLRVVQLKEMPYDEYLQTEEWKQRAANTKEQYNGLCALDASHAAVDAHHRTYARRGREKAKDLIPLCRECHERFHGKTR